MEKAKELIVGVKVNEEGNHEMKAIEKINKLRKEKEVMDVHTMKKAGVGEAEEVTELKNVKKVVNVTKVSPVNKVS